MPLQPMITGARYMIPPGHYLATEAGYAVLEAGGNAVDAGVAAGITLGVVHSDQVQVSGVAPMVIYLAEREPHPDHPGRVDLERGLGAVTGEALAGLGHRVEWLPDLSIGAAGVCAIVADREAGVLHGGADPRRAARAMGW
jgi:gamma-glutamyltranspeptidase